MNQPLLRRIDPHDVGRFRESVLDVETIERARTIVEDVRLRGAEAVREFGEQFGELSGQSPLIYSAGDLQQAAERIDPETLALLERTRERIAAFARAQRESFRDLTVAVPGGTAGHVLRPVDSAGCYVPGGRYPLPSSALMTVVTAKAAGVGRIWVASPRPTEATLAAAAIAGADGLLAVGGAHAIAALAFGMDGVPPADLVAGPGNRFVTAAKHLVSLHAGIDMLAGPTELAVIADAEADARLIAADLLAQAEHDADASPILLATSPPVISGVELELTDQLTHLPTQAIARQALSNGFAVLCRDLPEACELCNVIAPEHVQLHVADGEALRHRLRHFGALFIGSGSAEVIADYGIGPNHVLPTGSSARFQAGLSVLTFLRPQSWLSISSVPEAASIYRDAAALARIEGLHAHARAAERRLDH